MSKVIISLVVGFIAGMIVAKNTSSRNNGHDYDDDGYDGEDYDDYEDGEDDCEDDEEEEEEEDEEDDPNDFETQVTR